MILSSRDVPGAQTQFACSCPSGASHRSHFGNFGRMTHQLVPLTGNDPRLDQHLKACTLNKSCCPGCRLASHYKVWVRHLTSQIPWLGFCDRPNDEGMGVGCLLCSAAGCPTAFGRFEVASASLKISALQKHEQSDPHVRAWRIAAEQTGLPAPAIPEKVNAPSTEVFQAALQRRLEGLACEAGLPAFNIGPEKLQKLTYCLAEAKRMMLRVWLKDNAVTIALQQDERHQRLLLRFTAASGSLERRSGVIGLAKNFGSGAGGIRNATESIVRNFCSPGSMTPPGQSACDAVLNQELFDCVRAKIEIFVADAAGDEQKAGDLMRSSMFPNIRLGLRDAAHATRRVIKRPFEADPTLRDIMQSLFFGKHSIVAALEHSHLLKNRFEHHVKTTTSVVQSSVRSLSLAKQRFDSTQTPLGRFVLFFEPFLATVIEISRERRR